MYRLKDFLGLIQLQRCLKIELRWRRRCYQPQSCQKNMPRGQWRIQKILVEGDDKNF